MKQKVWLWLLFVLIACSPDTPLNQSAQGVAGGICTETASTFAPEWAKEYVSSPTVNIYVCNVEISESGSYDPILREDFIVAKLDAWAPLLVIESNIRVIEMNTREELSFGSLVRIRPLLHGAYILLPGSEESQVIRLASSEEKERFITVELIVVDQFAPEEGE